MSKRMWVLVVLGVCAALVVVGILLGVSLPRESMRVNASCGKIMKHGVEENGCWKWTQADLTHICCID